NPATTWAAFDYTLPRITTYAKIVIKDITGKVIDEIPVNGVKGQKIWDTRNITPGVYIYTLTTETMNKSGKIVVQ
ncbi:MAG: hypothetical protein DRJ15_13415, partial [Bacteroidetes bacterium]